MVLDAKALTWAAKHDIDTAKLKKAKVPIYGKWYFPEVPPNVALINLETGQQEIFAERMVAGEVIYVPAADLVRAGLAPADFSVMEVPPPDTGEAGARALRAIPREPLVAMARPPGMPRLSPVVELDGEQLVPVDEAELTGIHMPSASVSPFVLGVGFCLAFLGLVTNPIIVVVGLLWMLAGAIAWIRVGVLEAAHGSHARGDHVS